MITSIVDALTKKRERALLHIANVEYVARFCEHLRAVRGSRPQMLVACMADVVQSYISRVESGSAAGIGCAALCRILEVYKEMEHASRHS